MLLDEELFSMCLPHNVVPASLSYGKKKSFKGVAVRTSAFLEVFVLPEGQ